MPIKRWLFIIAALSVLLGASVRAQTVLSGIVSTEDPVVGDLAGGEADVWSFQAQAGQVLHLSAERYPPNPATLLDPALTVYGPDGEIIAEDDDGGVWSDALLLNVPITQSGAHRVEVRNQYDWDGGSYQLTLAESSYPAECSTPLGEVMIGEMPSAVSGASMRYRVLLPPCHAEWGRAWPYVLLMHGSNASDEHWQRLGADEALARGVALGRVPPMALVLPFGGALANTNVFREGASYESLLVDEFVTHVEARYCLQRERAARGIGGISRGGFWAFLVALRHPALFGALGGHSPFFDLYHAPPTHNPLDLALAPPPDPPLRIWMDRGQNDYAQVNIDLQHARLTENGIAHVYQLNPVGQHENAYWSAHLDDYLAFYSADWPHNPDDLPLCIQEAAP